MMKGVVTLGELYLKVRVNRLVKEYLQKNINEEQLYAELKKLLEIARESENEEYIALILKLLKKIEEEGNIDDFTAISHYG